MIYLSEDKTHVHTTVAIAIGHTQQRANNIGAVQSKSAASEMGRMMDTKSSHPLVNRTFPAKIPGIRTIFAFEPFPARHIFLT